MDTTSTSLTSAEAEALTWALGPTFDGVGARTIEGGARVHNQRWRLLPALHAVNDAHGWISPAAVDEIARRLDLGPAEVYGVASFYDLFAFTERPATTVRACVDLACRAANPDLADGPPPGAVATACLGLCERAPAAIVVDHGSITACGPVTTADLDRLVHDPGDAADRVAPAASVPQVGDPDLVLLARVGGDPLDLDRYLATGGFDALAAAKRIGPDATIEAITASGLVGRGGAAFPTGRKWEAVRRQRSDRKYLVCNADESEPGTFKDRTLMENDPFTLIEGVLIGMYSIGASRGFWYLRGEYGRAWTTLAAALDRVRRDPRTAPHLDQAEITLFKGAGAYICGEETAVFSSIEGHRGEPRNKPPFPFEYGLFGQPTAVNNVETLANVAPIIAGHAAGAPIRANRRLFCVAGAVAKPGVYEAELGLTLVDLIDRAGGLRSGSELQAVLLGGAAGAFVGPDRLDLVLDHDAVREAGLSLGSGVVLVYDQHVDLADQVLRVAEFFRHESCGQCVPCRVGTVRQHEALQRIAANASAGADRATDLALLDEIVRAMTDASICGLGQTAGNAVSVAIRDLGVFGDD